jgi:hypothetical protein
VVFVMGLEGISGVYVDASLVDMVTCDLEIRGDDCVVVLCLSFSHLHSNLQLI